MVAPFLAALLTAWACPASASSQVTLADPDEGVLHRSVISSVERLLRINEPVMDVPLVLAQDQERLRLYEREISSRFSHDICELDGSGSAQASNGNIAVLATSPTTDVVFVVRVRVRGASSGGSFQNLPSVIYEFDRATGNFLGVSPSHY